MFGRIVYIAAFMRPICLRWEKLNSKADPTFADVGCNILFAIICINSEPLIICENLTFTHPCNIAILHPVSCMVRDTIGEATFVPHMLKFQYLVVFGCICINFCICICIWLYDVCANRRVYCRGRDPVIPRWRHQTYCHSPSLSYPCIFCFAFRNF